MTLFSSVILFCGVIATTVTPASSPLLNTTSNNSFEYIHTPLGEGADSYGDIYETNNNIDTATRLIHDNFIYMIHIKFK